MKWFKLFWTVVLEEVTLKSSYGIALGTDTFRRWLGTAIVFLLFYWCAYHFDEFAVQMDNWFYEQFGWAKSTPPSAGKIAWHRALAAGLSGITILAATIEYLVWLRRRIRARRAARKAQIRTDCAPDS